MEERWKRIPRYARYEVSDQGRVMNSRTERILGTSLGHSGMVRVALFDGHQQITCSLALLVAEAFVPGQDDFSNTPLHINGDPSDNRAVNLAWRSRSFALRHRLQYTQKSLTAYMVGPVRHVATGEIFETIVDAARQYGLLVQDVRRSCYDWRVTLQPGGHKFEWANR
jgi:hypothetical protein